MKTDIELPAMRCAFIALSIAAATASASEPGFFRPIDLLEAPVIEGDREGAPIVAEGVKALGAGDCAVEIRFMLAWPSVPWIVPREYPYGLEVQLWTSAALISQNIDCRSSWGPALRAAIGQAGAKASVGPVEQPPRVFDCTIDVQYQRATPAAPIRIYSGSEACLPLRGAAMHKALELIGRDFPS